MPVEKETTKENELSRVLSLFDSTMIVTGSMIGTGIFIVSSEIARQLGSPGWLLMAWVVTGLLTLAAALSYGELAAMMPRAGGQYIYLRDSFSPLWGFLYGWTLFFVIQTGTIAAVGVGFSRYLGTFAPAIAEDRYLIGPIRIAQHYALSLSTAQLTAIAVVMLLTWANMRGINYGKSVQNVFTCAKLLALGGVILAGLVFGWSSPAARMNFSQFWTVSQAATVAPGVSVTTAFGLLAALCVVQTGSLFSADAWNNITLTAGEVTNPRRNIPLSLFFGTGIVIGLYLLANIAYLTVLPFADIQHAPADRVAGLMLQRVFPQLGAQLMAAAIIVSAAGCMNGMVLAGARAYYAMARDGLFIPQAARLNRAHVPGVALMLQALWTILIISVRTYDPATQRFGNLFSDLLDYVISAALLFYILTITGLFVLRRRAPERERPYRAFGYPVVPALYIAGAGIILLMLFAYRAATTWPGLVIVALGAPVYLALQYAGRNRARV
jgi:basic amino acid/polyamine antiporter, APA family